MSASTSRLLNSEHAEHLARLRIPPDMLEIAGVRSVTDAEAREMLGLHGHHGAHLGGTLFPYRSPLTGNRVGARIRLDHPLPDDSGKYISEPGCRQLFFAPAPKEWLSDSSIPVVLVESEKAALAILALAMRVGRKLISVAVGGCWGWLRTAGNQALPNGGHEPVSAPSPSLDLVVWRDRTIIILFDSNAATNPKVRKARRLLAQELGSRGACVYIGEVPVGIGANGPDDLVAISGDDAALRILDAVQKFDECAFAECQQALAVLEADKQADPLVAIEAFATIENVERRALLIGRLVALQIPGASRKFIEQQVGCHRTKAEADRRKAADACKRGLLMAMDVNGAALLGEIYASVRRFVVLSVAQALVVALWVAHTYVFEAADTTPYLSVTSPEKRSGKSRILEVCNTMVAKPWLTGRVTAAVLYRKVDAESPTLLLDESDAAFKSGKEYSEALRGILNTGHGRGGMATCCVGKGADISYQDFSTFSPKMIAGIGKLPDTVADRSVPIRLQRKTRDEKVDRFRRRDAWTEAERLRECLEAWGAQNVERLRGARPELPEELSDRQQDGAEPLLAIADLAGGEWPKAARHALVLLCCGAQTGDDSIGTLLLSDIRQIFKARDTDRLPSAELSNTLAEIETSPWSEWNHGKPITPPTLARLLRVFGITPHNIRIGAKTPKGYETGDFQDAWTRYARASGIASGSSPDHEPATPPQANADASFDQLSKCHEDVDGAAQQYEKFNRDAVCGGVAVAVSPRAEAAKSRPREEL